MGRTKFTPVQKRAITMLRNSGITVNITSANVAASAPAAPAKDRGWVCEGDGTKPCYKAGHVFSQVGALGDPAKGSKGHSHLNPTHVMVRP